MYLTRKEAGRYLINYQELANPRNIVGKQGIKEFFNKVGSIQYDPLNTVGYNPNLVLQSRVKKYKINMLSELLYKDNYLIDGWDKCMCIYKRSDWQNFKRVRKSLYINSPKYNNKDITNLIPIIKKVIKENGPICSQDLDYAGKVKWFWGEARIERAVLEYLYYNGELIIHHKVGTRKYYDLAENQIDAPLFNATEPHESEEQYYRWHVNRRVRSIGLLWNRAGDAWLGIKGLKSKERQDSFNYLEENGEFIRVEIEDIKYPFYIPKDYYETLGQVLNNYPKTKKISFIAPLDNFIWDRKLIEELFNFKYTWEVYTPANKRKYGYYVLPVLYGDKFIARFEPRLNKKSNQLVIINWWWEDGIRVTKGMKKAINDALKDFTKYLDANEVIGQEKILIK